MGLISLPNVDEIASEKDPKKQMEMMLNTMGILMKNLSELNGYLTTKNIKELHADVIIANTITADKLDVQELSAITANMGKLISGEIYGAYIATSEGTYPRAEMSSSDNFFKASTNANSYVAILPFYNPLSAPMIQLTNVVLGSSGDIYINDLNGKFTINSGNIIRLSRGGQYLEVDGLGVKVPDWASVRNGATSQTLQQALDALITLLAVKATSGAATSSNGAHNHGIPNGATWETSAGPVTWSAAAAHAHNQT